MKDPIEIGTVITRTDEIISADMDGETVMMSIEQGNYYGLNPIGSRIWELIEAPVSVSSLCDTLQAEFDVCPETCQQDVLEFLNQLKNEEILEIIDESTE
jgi:hypothetical protein